MFLQLRFRFADGSEATSANGHAGTFQCEGMGYRKAYAARSASDNHAFSAQIDVHWGASSL
ncbi:hypothetical protein D3C72_2264280 [compost metagenome]